MHSNTSTTEIEQPELLSISGLSAWYTKEHMVLNDISLTIHSHEIIGLIGLNGACKTTFINTLSGLHHTYECGQLCHNHQPFSFTDPDFKHHRYTVFAEDHSFSYFTFKEYCTYVFCCYQKEMPDLTNLICGFHFESFTNKLLSELSTGNLKKAYLITALAL